jgi:hypothetical protein
MVKKRSKSKTGGTRTVYVKSAKRRRTSKLNRSTVPAMKSTGALIGAGITYGPYVVQSIKGKSVNPIVGAVTSKDVAISGLKSVAIGYIGGAVAGKVIDAVGLKKPVNKVFRTVRGLF